MFAHLIKHTIRLFFRNGMYSIINLLGLSAGLSVGIIILMIISHQLSFDRFHTKGDHINQLGFVYHSKDQSSSSNTIPAAIGPSLKEAFPEVESVTRVSAPAQAYLSVDETIIVANMVSWADSSFFDTFSFQLLRGNPTNALTELYTVVLTEKTALSLFGDKDPMGQVVRLNNADQYVVTGIVKEPPSNSHIRFDALLSFSTLYEDRSLHMGWDGGNRYMNYVVMAADADMEAFREKLPDFMFEKINERLEPYGVSFELKLFPLQRVYLHSGFYGNPILYIYVFGAIAVFILLIACFNFTNISTAQAIRRARETGIRKVAGATKRQLIIQYLGEALTVTLIAFLIAVVIVEFAQPYLNAMIQMELRLFHIEWDWFVPILVSLFFITGITAGAYPAFYLSSFRPVKVLKGGLSTGRGKATLSMMLVVLQFVISMTLINTSLVIFRQLSYMHDYDLGMDTRDVVWIRLPSQSAKDAYETIRGEVTVLAGVEACGATSEIPGAWITSNGYRVNDDEEVSMIHVLDVDAGFFETLGIEVVEGRHFSQGSITDQTTYLVNETFMRQFNIEDFTTARIHRGGSKPIIGVVDDFHFISLKHPVKPLIITNEPWQGFDYMLVKVNMLNRAEVLNQLEGIWKRMLPGDPFIIGYVDDYLGQAYQLERRVGQLFTSFTGLSLFIACIGLFGLSSLLIRQRQKEIGLRKLLGASTTNVLKLVSSTYTKLVILANLITIIPVYYIVKTMLSHFSYTVTISAWWFVLTGLASLILAWVTVGWQSYQITKTNPAEVIKCE